MSVWCLGQHVAYSSRLIKGRREQSWRWREWPWKRCKKRKRGTRRRRGGGGEGEEKVLFEHGEVTAFLEPQEMGLLYLPLSFVKVKWNKVWERISETVMCYAQGGMIAKLKYYVSINQGMRHGGCVCKGSLSKRDAGTFSPVVWLLDSTHSPLSCNKPIAIHTVCHTSPCKAELPILGSSFNHSDEARCKLFKHANGLTED